MKAGGEADGRRGPIMGVGLKLCREDALYAGGVSGHWNQSCGEDGQTDGERKGGIRGNSIKVLAGLLRSGAVRKGTPQPKIKRGGIDYWEIMTVQCAIIFPSGNISQT